MRRLSFGLLLVLAACGGGSGKYPTDDFGEPGQDGSSVTSDLGLECANVTVNPVDGVTPTTLTATAVAPSGSVPTWTVTTPSGVVTPMSNGPSGLSVYVVATTPGTYDFHVSLANGTCEGDNSVEVVAPMAAQVSYRLRLTPPASSGLPQQDSILTVTGMTPQSDHDVFLVMGTPLGGVLRGPSGAIPGEVQLFQQAGPEFTVAVDGSGSFSLPLSVDATYQMVLIPSDPTLAPSMLGPMTGASLFGQPFTVGAGVVVSGTVRDPSAQPLAATSVALRAGVLPTGLGVSAADGTYSLHAVAGTYALAAAVAGWPDVSLDNVTIGASGATIDIEESLARQSYTFDVVHSDGTTPVAGAQLGLRSRALANAASVDVNGVAQAATGVMRASGTSDSNGTYATVLPAATYDVMLTPPAGASEGATGLAVVVSGSTIKLALAQQLTFTGLVEDTSGNPVASATVSVLSSDGSFLRSSTSGANGQFIVALDAGVPVDLQIDPPDASAFSSVRAHLGAIDGTLGGTLPSTLTVALPAGLPIQGFIRGLSGAPLAGVAVDLLCLSCGSQTAIAHASSSSTGSYRLAVPDPGGLEVDGGADGP